MSYERTFAIKVTCDHEPGDYEEDRAMRAIERETQIAIRCINCSLPAGWRAEEADEVEEKR